MTEAEEKILERFSSDTLMYFLREKRHKAIASWSILDVVGTAENLGFVMSEDAAIDIIADIDRGNDNEYGITWETIKEHIEMWISENSFKVDIEIESTGEKKQTLFCELETNDNISEYWNDDSYHFYDMHKETVINSIGKLFPYDNDCVILKVL